MRTPLVHFDFMQRHVPFGREGYEVVRRSCRGLSDAELLDGVISGWLADLDGTSRAIGFAMMLYERLGQNTFVVGPRVQDLFSRTSLSKVSPDMLVPPARAFYVALADCPWRIWGGDRTLWHHVSGAYVSFTVGHSESTGDTPCNGINFCIWGGPNARSVDNADDAVLWHSINLDLWEESGEDLETFFGGSRVMSASPGASDFGDGCVSLPDDEDDLNEQREMVRHVMRTALNVCLYTSSEDPDLEVVDSAPNLDDLRRQLGRAKASGKRKKLERRIASAATGPKTRVVYIGPMFEAAPEPSRSGARGGASPDTHASPVEHTVRPHYQRYWVGSGATRRRVWKYRAMHARGSGKPDRTVTKIREPE